MFTENVVVDNIGNIVIAIDLKMTSKVFKTKKEFFLSTLSKSSIFMGNSAEFEPESSNITNISTYMMLPTLT
jgi:hypothetical protein